LNIVDLGTELESEIFEVLIRHQPSVKHDLVSVDFLRLAEGAVEAEADVFQAGLHGAAERLDHEAV